MTEIISNRALGKYHLINTFPDLLGEESQQTNLKCVLMRFWAFLGFAEYRYSCVIHQKDFLNWEEKAGQWTKTFFLI